MELLNYLIKASACTALFFGFYLLVLRKLTFFKINRFYLLTTLVLSFIIPALQINFKQAAKEAEVLEIKYSQSSNENLNTDFKITSQAVIPENKPIEEFNWLKILPIGYSVVTVLLLSFGMWKLFLLIKQASKFSRTVNGLKLVSKVNGFTNCSFFKYVFINEDTLSESELMVLLRHEQVHANQFHSIDKIILMVLKAVMWFNPIIYLYDQLLEQVHEYEADETTSSSFGDYAYANLLLKLAVAKSDMPLVHNFVKSPIKDRIKMLFHSKSKNMKKLMYLLALPIGLGLVWLFAVQVVYAQNDPNIEVKEAQALMGKVINGRILVIKKGPIGTSFIIASGLKKYPIEASAFAKKVKINDEVALYISGFVNNITKTEIGGKTSVLVDKPLFTVSKVTTKAGKPIWELEKNAFLYEANKARFATSIIKVIQKSTNSTINKMVLNDGLFTINLNLSKEKFISDNFKVGDSVLVKFIGEKAISKNTFSTDKMIVMYSLPKKYELKNQVLYDRFYQPDGRQKGATTFASDPAKKVLLSKPKSMSFKKLSLDNSKNKSRKIDTVLQVSGGISKGGKINYFADSVIFNHDKSIVSLLVKQKFLTIILKL